MSAQPTTTALVLANSRSDGLSYGNTTLRRSAAAVMRCARVLWSSKVAAELALRANVSVRTAEAWLAGDRGIGGEPLASLLASDHGVAFLQAIIATMPDVAQRRWNREFEKAAERADLRRLEAEIESKRRMQSTT